MVDDSDRFALLGKDEDARKVKTQKRRMYITGTATVLAIIFSFIAIGLADSAIKASIHIQKSNISPPKKIIIDNDVIYPNASEEIINFGPRQEFQKYLNNYLLYTSHFMERNISYSKAIANPVEEIAKFIIGKSLIYRWRVENITHVFNNVSFFVVSKALPIKGYNLTGEASLRTSEDNEMHLIFTLFRLGNGSHKAESSMILPMLPRIYFLLRDMRPNDSEDLSRMFTNHPFNNYFKSFIYIFTLGYNYDFNIPTYVDNGTISFDIYVEPPFITHSSSSHNGVVIWEFKDPRDEYGDQTNYLTQIQPSPYFYTSRAGYKVQAELRLVDSHTFEPQRHDTSLSTHLSVTIYFLVGKNDADLDYNFPHKTTITIFNQKDSSRSIVTTSQHYVMDSTSYKIKVGTNFELEEDGIFVDGSLIYKIAIHKIKNFNFPDS